MLHERIDIAGRGGLSASSLITEVLSPGGHLTGSVGAAGLLPLTSRSILEHECGALVCEILFDCDGSEAVFGDTATFPSVP